MTSVLVVYDGWANLRVLGAVAVILGPVVAMVIGHVFAARRAGRLGAKLRHAGVAGGCLLPAADVATHKQVRVSP